MAINKAVRYPGRWEASSSDYPMGKPKNRTSETSKDGTYFEKDWLSDYEAFFGALMNDAGFSANGITDTAQASQLFDALVASNSLKGGVTTLFENTSGVGNGVTIDWSATGHTLNDFDLIELRGVTNNSVIGGGGDSFVVAPPSHMVGYGQIAICESSRSGGTDGYAFAGVDSVGSTSLVTKVLSSGSTYDAAFIGVYGIKL